MLEACRASRSRSLYPAVLLALNTCMRYSELRLLRWEQVNLNSCTLTVGLSKTDSGTGRLLPLNDRAIAILGFWASLFPARERHHYVFCTERYSASGDGLTRRIWQRPNKTYRPLEGSVGIREDSCGGLLSLPRSEAHWLYADAGSGRALLRSGDDHGMEREHHSTDGEMLRPHWTGCTAASGACSKQSRFSGRWGTKLGTVPNATCATTS